VAVPVCVTADPLAARGLAAKQYALAADETPSYRAMLDREGLAGPADLAVIGDEDEVRDRLERFVAAGADDVVASLFGTREETDRTRALLRSLAG
jgi:alkanesulfonate monooxygenase SsuD/methylene tetrahydromethanopterin reductase-like flavin-dependent oxidoreductase (luciferase family)